MTLCLALQNLQYSRKPGLLRWTKGTCAQELGNRSYQVKVGSCKYRRNRRDLLKTGEKPFVDSPEVDAPIYGIIASRQLLHLRPPILILHTQIPTLLDLESPVAAARLQFGKGAMSGTIECFCFSLLLMLDSESRVSQTL